MLKECKVCQWQMQKQKKVNAETELGGFLLSNITPDFYASVSVTT